MSKISQVQGKCEGHVNDQDHNEHQGKRNVNYRLRVKVKMRAKFMDKV